MSEKNSNKSKRYTNDFKKQIVELFEQGKKVSEIVSEYGIARSTIFKWIADYSSTGSFKAKDNRGVEEQELIQLKKELNLVIKVFKDSRGIYGTRKIKKKYNLQSKYTLKHFKVHKSKCNEDSVNNELNREIIGYSAGAKKESKLVLEAFYKVEIPLSNVKILHTDRGSEFKNKTVDDILSTLI